MHGYLRPLANFALIVEAGSLTAAANKAGVSPSVMSDSVKTLETRVGEPLLERQRRGVIPTARGAEMARHAATIVTELGLALDDAAQADMSGPVRVSIPAELAHGWFEPAFAALRDSHPGLDLHVFVEDSIADYSKFARDLYVRVGPYGPVTGLTALHTTDIEVSLVGHPDLVGTTDITDPAAIAELPLIGIAGRAGPATVMLRSPDGPHDLAFQSTLRVSDVAARLTMARAGLGLVACLRPSVARDLDAGRLVALLPGRVGPERVTATIGSPHRKPPPKSRAVAEALHMAIACA